MAEKEEQKKEDGKEGTGAAPEADATSSAGKKKKLLLIVGFVVLVLAAAGTSTAVVMMKKPAADGAAELSGAEVEDQAMALEGAGEDEEIGDDEERLGAIAPLETFVVNLAGGGFLRLQVQLEFDSIDIPTRFISRSVPIRDGLIALLTKRTASELETPKGKEDLKSDIRNVANELMRREDVKRVYFTQFVVQ